MQRGREGEKERKGSRREKDELRRFRRRIKREENKLAQKRIGNVGRWSAGKKKEEGPERKKSLRHACTTSSSSFHRNDSTDTRESFRRLGFPRRPHTSECRHAVSLARFSAYAAKVFVERHFLVL